MTNIAAKFSAEGTVENVIVVSDFIPEGFEIVSYPIGMGETKETAKNRWLLQNLREERDRLLAESDIYVLPDRWANYDDATKAAWETYRQALRDLPSSTVDLENPNWPLKPS